MQRSWKARKMIPGRDTLDTMAMHYGITTVAIRNILFNAGADLIREDGFRGQLKMVAPQETSLRSRPRKVLGWSDGQVGIDTDTTKLTRSAIDAVVQWKIQNEDTAA